MNFAGMTFDYHGDLVKVYDCSCGARTLNEGGCADCYEEKKSNER